MLSVTDVIGRSGAGGVLPLLTLDEFFDGNGDEESLAPNQWGYGRPPLAELAARLAEIAGRPEVAWVRVQPHPETLDLEQLAGEAVALCARVDEAARAAWVEGFESSGVIAGLVDEYREVPPVPAGATVWSVLWD